MSAISDAFLSTGFSTYSRLRGFTIGRVDGAFRKTCHDQLVQKIFFESGYFESADTPLAELTAGMADCSFLVERKNRAVGAVTLLESTTIFPVEEFFNIRLPEDVRREEVAELTRFVIERDFRRQDPVVSVKLLQAALVHSRRRGIRWWIWCGPSVFLWGFQAFFQHPRVLEQLPLTKDQVEMRKGRESYFSESKALRVVLIDLDSISLTNSALEMLRRRKLRQKRSKRR